MAIEFITFLLAIIGYVGLAANTVLISQGKFHQGLITVAAMVIVIHVLMVWHFRYEWQFSEATRNGYVGFLLFHFSLLAIGGATIFPENQAKWLIILSFLIVSVGAIGATFRYEVVTIYRYPVLLIAVVGVGFLLRNAQLKFRGGS